MKNENLLYRKLFLASIFLLLLNDFYLKYHFHNYFTGKLSDFVGLFAFPYFFSVLLKRKVKLTFILTGVLFIFWKSNSSQFFIDYLNNYGIGINRIVDYSDLMALLILPISYLYRTEKNLGIKKINFLPKPIIIGICSFAFIATTLPRESGKINLKSEYQAQFHIPKGKVLRILLKASPNNPNSKYQTVIEFPEKKSRVIISTIISELENNKTNVKLDSILFFITESSGFFSGVKKKNVNYMKNLKLEDFEKLFIEKKINQLKEK